MKILLTMTICLAFISNANASALNDYDLPKAETYLFANVRPYSEAENYVPLHEQVFPEKLNYGHNAKLEWQRLKERVRLRNEVEKKKRQLDALRREQESPPK